MAGVGFHVNTAAIATGTNLKTLLQVIAATNQRIMINRVSINFAGTASDGVPIPVDILRQTSAGTMSALTPKKANDADDETLQVTAQHTSTGEPVAGDILYSILVHPQTSHTWVFAPDEEIPIGGGDRLGLRVHAAAGINARASMSGTE